MAELNCRHFNGYRPCGRSPSCAASDCGDYAPVGRRVLIIHLEALGAVLRSTSLVAAVRRAYPGCVITWVTKAPALLENLGLERVLTLASEDQLRLRALRFDLALVIDKCLVASGVLQMTHADEVRGFKVDREHGVIVPANPEAHALWELGLSDHAKFFVNQKTEQQLTHEALALGPYRRDEYRVELSLDERTTAKRRRAEWGRGKRAILGVNTGSSPTLAAKKLPVAHQRELIARVLEDQRFRDVSIVLLGGREDTARNLEIARDLPVIVSPSEQGLRDGLASVEACDLVFSGDSLGMHMAIGLKKWVVAWFGPTCAHEIDLYGRGSKVLTSAPCAPCWKRDCQRTVMCYDQLDFARVLTGLEQGLNWLTSSSKPPTPEIFSLASPF